MSMAYKIGIASGFAIVVAVIGFFAFNDDDPTQTIADSSPVNFPTPGNINGTIPTGNESNTHSTTVNRPETGTGITTPYTSIPNTTKTEYQDSLSHRALVAKRNNSEPLAQIQPKIVTNEPVSDIAEESEATPTKPLDTKPLTTKPEKLVTRPMTHTINKGETLIQIADTFYGSPRYWRLIANANPSINPNRIRPGQTLILPDKAYVPPTRAEELKKLRTTLASNTAKPVIIKTRTGDTLSEISQRVYGSAKYWNHIYLENRDALSTPNVVPVNIALVIPPKPQ